MNREGSRRVAVRARDGSLAVRGWRWVVEHGRWYKKFILCGEELFMFEFSRGIYIHFRFAPILTLVQILTRKLLIPMITIMSFSAVHHHREQEEMLWGRSSLVHVDTFWKHLTSGPPPCLFVYQARGLNACKCYECGSFHDTCITRKRPWAIMQMDHLAFMALNE